MAGAGTYNVGYGKDFGTITEALAALVADQGTTPFAATQRIVFHDSYLKENVVVPSTLVPTSSYKLVITTYNNRYSYWQPTHTYDTALTIADIDYVQVENFFIANPKFGILINRSDNITINGVEILDASSAAIKIEDCNKIVICNTAIKGARNALVINSSKNIVVVYSSIGSGLNTPLSGPVSGKAVSVSWDYNTYTTETPDSTNKILYLFNSIIYSGITQDGCITYGYGTEKFVEADGNIYSAASSTIGYLFTYVNSVSYFTYIEDLPKLRILTGQDENSITDYVPGVSSKDGVTRGVDEAGVHYGNLSDAFKEYIAKGLKRSAVAGRLPSWVDSTIFEEDIDGDERGDGETPGPKGYTSASDYNLFLDFVGNTSEQPSDYESGVDRAVRAIDSNIVKIIPEINDGYFYIKDKRYYLYGNKVFDYLEDMTWFIVELDDYYTVLNAYMFQTGEELGEQETDFIQQGKTVYVRCNIDDMNNLLLYNHQIRLFVSKKEYDVHVQGINETRYSEYYDLYKLDKRFFFRVNPVEGSPVVVTDSEIETSAEQSIVPFIYGMAYDEYSGKTELLLEGNKNLFIEPHFSGLKDWGTEGDTYASTSYGLMGSPYKVVAADGEIILQDTLYKKKDENLMLSFYLNDKSRGTIKVKTIVYDNEDEEYSVEETSIGLAGSSTDTWKRYALLGTIEDDVESDFSIISPDHDLGTFSIKIQDNDIATKIKFQILSQGSSTSEIDCLMATETNILEKYSGLSEYITVEYESSEERVRHESPLGLSPIVNAQNSGFLAIRNLRAEIFGSYPATATTLNDYSRSFRAELPWAKVGGPSKYHNLEEDYLYECPAKFNEITETEQTSIPSAIETIPHSVTLSNTNKSKVSIKIRDQYNNPSKHEDVTCELYNEYSKYPGMICLREMSIPSKYGTTVIAETDTAGNIDLLLEGPDEEFFTTFTTSEIVGRMVETLYPVDPYLYGNPRIYNPIDGTYLDIQGDRLTEEHTASVVDNRNVVTLDYYPKVDSIEVRVSNTSEYDCLLQESIDQNITKDEYYVDYSNKKIKYHKDRDDSVQVEYDKQLVYNTTYNSKDAMYLEQELVDILSSDMILLHNTAAELSISCKGVEKIIDITILQNDI